MTEQQWALELADHLRGTGWVIERSGVTRINGILVGLVCHPATGQRVHIGVSEHGGQTAGCRRAELLGQLVI